MGSPARRCSALASAYRVPVALPPLAHLFLTGAQVVGRGCERQGALHLHEDHGPDLVGDPTLAVECLSLLKQIPLREDRRGALEAVPLARDRVDDVDLYRRVVAQVLHRARRADVGEDQMVIVPDGGCPLRREVGGPIRADGGGEALALLLDHRLMSAEIIPKLSTSCHVLIAPG